MTTPDAIAALIRANPIARLPGHKRLNLKGLSAEEKIARRNAMARDAWQRNKEQLRTKRRTARRAPLTDEQKLQHRQHCRNYRQRRRDELARLRQLAAAAADDGGGDRTPGSDHGGPVVSMMVAADVPQVPNRVN